MSFEEIALKEAISAVKHIFRDVVKEPDVVSMRVADGLTGLTLEAKSWASSIQIFGMNAPLDATKHTAQLSFGTPRKFVSMGSSQEDSLSEEDILGSKRNLMLLGDPGSGKTTTMKRLTNELHRFRLSSIIRKKSVPIPIILREEEIESLYFMIARKIGILDIFRDPRSRETNDPYKCSIGEKEKSISLGSSLPTVLNQMRAILLLDGLDELDLKQRLLIEKEIRNLSRRLKQAKIIVTCRSGSFTREMADFQVAEISPLDQSQIEEVASYWIDDPRQFFHEVERLKLKDICDRPLLLTQTILFYKKEGYLPKAPSRLYRSLVMLLLREWDEQRGISRRSCYSQFEIIEKYEFLSALAYELTVHRKKTAFRESDMKILS